MRDRKLLNIEMDRVSPGEYRALPASGLVMVLDNVRSAHNVGAAFRTADAFKVDQLYLCGITACPPSAQIHKSALGAEDAVPWEHVADTLEAVRRLQAAGYTVLAVEQTVHSRKLGTGRGALAPEELFRREDGGSYALVFGNEVSGVRQEVVDAADLTVEIPQYGTKHSLNVSVSMGVVLWELVR